MITLYAFQTSNVQRAAITLEECGVPYRVERVDLSKGEQRRPEFVALNPAGAVPVIVDSDGPGGAPLTLSQSAAIQLYLAEKTGRFLPSDALRRALAHQWLMFAVTDCAPSSTMIFFNSALLPDKSPANGAFFEERLTRQFRVADARLRDRAYLADELSVADFALYPLVAVRKALLDKAGDMPNLSRWFAEIGARPAVARGMRVGE